jgi:hypothetical protein
MENNWLMWQEYSLKILCYSQKFCSCACCSLFPLTHSHSNCVVLPTQNSTLLECFWPSNNSRSNHVRGAIPPIIDVDPETMLSLHIMVPKKKQFSLKIAT